MKNNLKNFGETYSQYYDLLYQDKNYHDEVDFINNLIAQVSGCRSKTILDMGCGTGKHAELFVKKGYAVHGIDVSSEMLKIAEKRRHGVEDKLSFSKSNINELNLNNKFDVVVSLFHVINYQNSNQDLINTFKKAKQHLLKDGLFIFDFWYGPAVLTDLPSTRIKRLKNNTINVTRLAEPEIYPQDNIVEVDYDIFIENNNGKVDRKSEKHKIRYLFDTELEIICNQVGFDVKYKSQWMTNKKPSFDSWNVVWVVKNL